MKQALVPADEHRHQRHAGANGHHAYAAFDIHAAGLLDPCPLREYQQIPAVPQALDGGLDGGDVGVSPIHTEYADGPQKGSHHGNFHQLLLGHDPQGEVLPHGAYQQDGVHGAGVIGAQQYRLILGEIFQSLHPQRVKKRGKGPPCGPDKAVKAIFYHPILSFIMCSRASRLWSKSKWLVSSSKASSACRRGAVSRWLSAQSRWRISEST